MTAVTSPDGAMAAIYGQATERRDVQQPLVDLAAKTGWLCFHPHSSLRSARGFPDLTFVRSQTQRTTHYGPPYILFVEAKSERGKLGYWQLIWGKALSCIELASGGAIVYRVVRPSSRHELEAILVGAQEGAGKPRLERELYRG